jgi:ribose 5-phosphate isomerase A
MNDELKLRAAMAAVDRVRPGMVLGLGSGSTAHLFVQELGRRLRDRDLRDVVGVPTSWRIERVAREAGVPLTTLNKHPVLDLTVDGADEVSPALDLLKGRGGALLREKIVARASHQTVIVVDSSKLVSRLGERTPIPVEVVRFGWQSVALQLESLGGKPSLRVGPGAEPLVTDEGHCILDCDFGPLEDPGRLAREIRDIVGVVEHGLFLGIAREVIVASPDRVNILTRESR